MSSMSIHKLFLNLLNQVLLIYFESYEKCLSWIWALKMIEEITFDRIVHCSWQNPEKLASQENNLTKMSLISEGWKIGLVNLVT